MTVEDAKNKLEEMRVEFDYTLHDEAVNAIDVALEALEKQIPKNVISDAKKLELIDKLITNVYDRERWDDAPYLFAVIDAIVEIINFDE